MKKKIVVLGSLGMAGHVMAEVLNETGDYEIFGVARQSGKYVDNVVDITNFSVLENYLKRTKPDYIINCIGVLVTQSKIDISSAILINSYLPHFLSETGKIFNYKLIHISTDCVFSGKSGKYLENSFRDGDDNYARTKALGEVVNDTDLTIRTSIIGPELKTVGTGLLDWFLKQKGSIKGYTEAYWSGVSTLELAKATLEFLKQDITGLYHLCPNEKISKHDLLKLFAEIWNKKNDISRFDDYKVDKSLICTRKDFIYNVPNYEKMFVELKFWMDNNHELYSNYQ